MYKLYKLYKLSAGIPPNILKQIVGIEARVMRQTVDLWTPIKVSQFKLFSKKEKWNFYNLKNSQTWFYGECACLCILGQLCRTFRCLMFFIQHFSEIIFLCYTEKTLNFKINIFIAKKLAISQTSTEQKKIFCVETERFLD